MTMVYAMALAAVAVGAITGALVAGRKNMDGIGVLVLAVATGIGGGTLRDMLLGTQTFWIHDQTYLLVAAGAGLATMWTAKIWLRLSKSLVIADAIALALFTGMGAEKAMDLQLSWALVVTMGVITGVAGGVMRDVLAAEVPCVFVKGEFYTTAAILAVLVMLLLHYAGLGKNASIIIGDVFCVALRLAALRWKWTLPVFRLRA